MPKDIALPGLITGLSLLAYFVFQINVGRARVKYNVQPPQTAGNPDFERVVRVHQNTLEQLVLYLPSLWLFALLINPVWAAGLGGLWILGRILYAWGYYKAAEKRGPGFGISALATLALLIGGIVGAVRVLLAA
ncbi:MAPEG family protein [Polyangium aurulentum]|uniref:MAPEG family protein n=1 Tax=Polyangium aurulentum TaxID=2567896 RepID=UPI0010AE9056|nr:MAPEG family protein [Polyangium aurulentum]UQA60321.1 MAPEG family protein [Polyangium aurulentum]